MRSLAKISEAVYLANLSGFRVWFCVNQSRKHVWHFESLSLQRRIKINVFNGRKKERRQHSAHM
jgi:hypothetical protein